MNTKLLAIFICIAALTMGCDNYRAKHWGGTMNVSLPKGEKLINATWKDEHLWYLTRPMHTDESAETFTFHEKSNIGIVQGTVVFIEQK